ncbi:MAG: hypothetical protein K9I94_04650 [Bacteroidales bacterium]|nr:hypothetical protein [Bacteroidales bacterium]
MNELPEILKYILPSLVMLATVYLMMRMFFTREKEKCNEVIQTKVKETTIPIRLQAFERIILMLERISPNNLLIRLTEQGMTSYQLQQKLISTIRDEFNHNLSQQLYVSTESWEQVKQAREEMVKLVNTAATEVNDDADANELARKIFEKQMQLRPHPVDRALELVKREVRQLF